MNAFFQQVWDILATIVVHLRDPQKWQEVLDKPGVFWPAVAALAFVIFAETGLLVGFFLPGDSLLVTVGIVARVLEDAAAASGEPSSWNLGALMAVLIVAAVVGDTVGYWFGAKAGPGLFNRPNSRWFKRDHLLAAKAFFDKHGGKTIVLARFMPFLRTFAPVVAGAAKMNYRWFVTYNVVGGVLWIGSMLLFGYFAVDLLEPPLKRVFGPEFELRKKVDVLAGVIILISVAPIAVGYLRKRVGNPVEPPTAVPGPANDPGKVAGA